jgi:membrane protein
MIKSRTFELVAIALLSGVGLMLARQPAGQSVLDHAHIDIPSLRNAPPPLPADSGNTGQGAASPAEIPASGWWAAMKRVVMNFNDHRLMNEAGSVVFFVLLAIFPALAALISLYGLFADPKTVADHLAALSTIMPGGSMDILRDQMVRLAANGGGKLSFGLLFGFGVSLWSANQGMKSLFDVLNIAYDEREKRSYVRLTLITLGFTLASLVFTMLAIAAVVVLPAVLNFIYLGAETDLLIRLLRWPVMLVVLTLFLSVIYRYGPSRRHARWQWVTWGGAFASVAWLLVSLAFSYYVSAFGTYNKTYGSLGAVVGFMTWIWISVMVVLLGAEMNAELERQTTQQPV